MEEVEEEKGERGGERRKRRRKEEEEGESRGERRKRNSKVTEKKELHQKHQNMTVQSFAGFNLTLRWICSIIREWYSSCLL